jgi:hypothetical protein
MNDINISPNKMLDAYNYLNSINNGKKSIKIITIHLYVMTL